MAPITNDFLPINAPPGFHLLAKPTGSTCNIDCTYCFFLSKESLYPNEKSRMSEVTLYRAIHAGGFPAVKVRGRYIVPARALDEMEDAAVSTGSIVDAADWANARGAA